MQRSTSHRRGFISFTLIRLLIPIGLLVVGGQGIYTAATNRSPLSMPFAEYVSKHSDASWVELKDTQLDLTGAIWAGRLGTVSEVYIPMHAPGEKENAKIKALLLTRDRATIDLVEQMKKITDEKQAIAFLLKNHEQLYPKRTVSGMVQFGIDSDSKKREKIAKLDANLTSDFAVIADGKKPEPLASIVFFVLAFPAAWLCWFRRSEKAAGPASPAMPPPLRG